MELCTQRLRKELHEEQDARNKTLAEMQSLQQQLKDAKQGLLAASRLSDQLESSQCSVASLREECKYQWHFLGLIKRKQGFV